MGLLLETSYAPGIFVMYGSTQGEFFLKAHPFIRAQEEESIDLWIWDTLVGKIIPLQLSLHFGGFPTLEQPQRCSSSNSTPKSVPSGSGQRQRAAANELWWWCIPMSPAGDTCVGRA